MSQIETIEVTDEWKMWADECAKLFGGLDILGLDFVCCDGKYVILELNDTAIGLVHEHEQEDMNHMRDIVLLRMEQIWTPKPELTKKEKKKAAAAAATATASASASDSTQGDLTEQVKLLQIELAREKQVRL